MKFLIYNAAGLTLPVEAEIGREFRFRCRVEECGKEVELEGRIIGVDEEEFNRVLGEVLQKNPSFSRIQEITSRKLVFEGKVNGETVKLPVESFDDFAERFMDEVLVLR